MMLISKSKIIFGLIFGFSLLFIFTAADTLAADCTLSSVSDSCGDGPGDTCPSTSQSLEITQDFVEDVINIGASFSLLCDSGLNVDVNSSSFTVGGVSDLTFSGSENINNQNLAIGLDVDNVDFGSIHIKSGQWDEWGLGAETLNISAANSINAPSSVFFVENRVVLGADGAIYYGIIYTPGGDVVLQGRTRTTASLIIGTDGGITGFNGYEGDIFTYKSSGAGISGDVVINGTYIDINSIQVQGYDNDAGNVTITGTVIKVGNVYTQSECWIKDASCTDSCNHTYGNAGLITVNNAIEFYAGYLYTYGRIPTSIDIETDSIIGVTAKIKTYGGCGGEVEKCDYPPCAFPNRTYCSDCSPSGDVTLRAGQYIYTYYIYTGSNPDFGSPDYIKARAIKAGNVTLETLDGWDRSGVVSWRIDARGLPPGDVTIGGKNIRIYQDYIKTSNTAPQAFPEELLISPGSKAGDILINASQDLSIDTDAKIDASAKYPFAPDGGNVTLTAGRNLLTYSGVPMPEPDLVPSIDTSGASLSAGSVGWYTINGVNVSPGGDVISNVPAWCAADTQNREYYNGTDAGYLIPGSDAPADHGDGLRGGDAGDITISAQNTAWQEGLILKAEGGDGSRGGDGKAGDYCPDGPYTGTVHDVMPLVGYGGEGGNGGSGGTINLNVNQLACFDSLYFSTKGGQGGIGGVYGPFPDISDGFSRYPTTRTDNKCDLEGWKGVSIQERKTAPRAGDGGAGAAISANVPQGPARPLTYLTALTDGGSAYSRAGSNRPYPFYCSDAVYPELPRTPGEVLSIAQTVYSDVQTVKNTYDNCINNCGGDSVCRNDCCITASKDQAQAWYGDEGCCGEDVIEKELPYTYNCDPAPGCYPINPPCRALVTQAPCQLLGFSITERVSYGPATGFKEFLVPWLVPAFGFSSGFSAEQARAGAFDGQEGATGGAAGSITISTYVDNATNGYFFAQGGDGSAGSLGQDSFVEDPGVGGDGGAGGAGALIAVPLAASLVVPGDYQRGAGGAGGGGGEHLPMHLPQADTFCADCSNFRCFVKDFYYSDWDKTCGVGEDYNDGCCPDRWSIDELQSCLWGDTYPNKFHNVRYGYTFIEEPIDGSPGSPGADGSSSSNPLLQSGEVCGPPPSVPPIVYPALPTEKHNICARETCVLIYGGGEDKCNGIFCSSFPVCGDGNIDPGEVCGEPGLAACPEGEECADCICQLPPVNNPPVAHTLEASVPDSDLECFQDTAQGHFQWVFTDPDGDAQGDEPFAHWIQVADNSGFNEPFLVDCKSKSKPLTALNEFITPSVDFTGDCSAQARPFIFEVGIYYWRVRVCDEYGACSTDWIYPLSPQGNPDYSGPGTSFNPGDEWPWPEFKCGLEENLAPENQVDCDDDSFNPLVDETVYFYNRTTGCDALPCEYSWDFGDSIGSSILQNPTYPFTADGEYDVTLTASEAGGARSCPKTYTIKIGAGAPELPFPIWIEIPPF